MPEVSASDSETGTTGASRSAHVRWKLGLGLIVLWLVVQVSAWMAMPDFTYQVMSVYYLSPAMAFLTLLWFLFVSGLSVPTRLTGLLILVALVGGFLAIFRHDGYSGAMVPRFSLRWEPSREERAAAFFADATAPERSPGDDGGATLVADADDWPQFRGPHRDGICRSCRIRRDWDANPPEEIWRHPVGLGWSSFAIVEERAWTQEQRGEREVVVCYDAGTGDQVWLHEDSVRFSSEMGGDGPRATPTFFESRIYALGATGILNCLDAATGELFWSRDILQDAQAENLGWGMAASPLVYEDRVVVNPGGDSGKAVIVYDRLSGEPIWSSGDHRASYCAVRRETLNGIEQLLIFDANGIAGLRADDGTQLWRKTWQNNPEINVAQPIIHEGQVFFSSGYGSGSALIDVTQVDEQGRPRVVWEATNRFKLKFNDGIYKDGFIYGLDEGILACIEAETGERRWKRGRYGYGQLLLIEDVLLVQAESGEVALVDASPDAFRERCRFPAIEGVTWNHPVVHHGRLFVRNSNEAACFDVAP